jgi:hypothetical protein
MRVRDGKNSDPGSGINITNPPTLLCRLSSQLLQSLLECFLPYLSLMLSGKLFQFSTVLTEKGRFLAYWENRPFTPAILRVLSPALLFVIVYKLWLSFDVYLCTNAMSCLSRLHCKVSRPSSEHLSS